MVWGRVSLRRCGLTGSLEQGSVAVTLMLNLHGFGVGLIGGRFGTTAFCGSYRDVELMWFWDVCHRGGADWPDILNKVLWRSK